MFPTNAAEFRDQARASFKDRGLPYIVGEVSCNWRDGRLLHPEKGTLSQRFEYLVNVNAARGYRLQSFSIHRLITQPSEMNETIVAVFARVEDASRPAEKPPFPPNRVVREGDLP